MSAGTIAYPATGRDNGPLRQIIGTVTIAPGLVIPHRWAPSRRRVVIRLRIRAEVCEIGIPVACRLLRTLRNAVAITATAALLAAVICILPSLWK